ncbi:hypothetical protein HMPREF1301_00244 [Propionibacterium sp. KPL2005]|nr:hypothetical protein HMPREF1301_00244 [Propionibacterium sp. KPL2005]ERS26758.1 hypothetical protein HMPREF1297_02348 [Propionibacterium sp. KPL2000]
MGKHFWIGCFERALKTFIQTFIATLGVGVGVVYTVDSVRGLPWLSALVTAAVAAILSVATSLGSPTFVAGKHPDAPAIVGEDAGLIEPPAEPALDIPADDPGMIEPVGDTVTTDSEPGSVAVARHAEV